MTADWDAIAAEIGLPANWREGYDSPEYMESADSIYSNSIGRKRFCCYPGMASGSGCVFKTDDVEALFRHVHGSCPAIRLFRKADR